MSKQQRRNATLVRMLGLLRLLHRNGAMTIRELAMETGVTSRTIYRDVNAMEVAHIPLVRRARDVDGRHEVRYQRSGNCPVCAR